MFFPNNLKSDETVVCRNIGLGSYWVGFGFDWVRYFLVQSWFFVVSPFCGRSWGLFLVVLKLGGLYFLLPILIECFISFMVQLKYAPHYCF